MKREYSLSLLRNISRKKSIRFFILIFLKILPFFERSYSYFEKESFILFNNLRALGKKSVSNAGIFPSLSSNFKILDRKKDRKSGRVVGRKLWPPRGERERRGISSCSSSGTEMARRLTSGEEKRREEERVNAPAKK